MQLSDCKVEIVRRHNKVVYRDGDRVIKVFNASKPAQDVFNEALNCARIQEAGVRVPRILEVSQVEDGSWALANEYIPSRTLSGIMHDATGDELKAYMDQFVELQLEIQAIPAPILLNNQKRKLIGMISVVRELDPTARYDLQMRADGMRSGRTICHGDFNPSNVLIPEDGGKPYVCDWTHVSRGVPEADAAMTYLELSLEQPDWAELYLDAYSVKADIPKQMIRYWLPVLAAAELSRGRHLYDEFLLGWINAAADFE